MTAPAIEVSDAWLSHRGRLVLEGVNFRVEPGDFVGIIGPNGAGKTTLLKVILGLIRLDRGSVRVFGRRPSEARGDVGYVPQHFHFDPDIPASVLDLVLMGRLRRDKLFKQFSSEDESVAVAALEEVELGPLATRQLGRLSVGEIQRALIARALAVRPRILLLDEPTASLDTRVGPGIYEKLEVLSRKTAVVLVSHDIGVISRHVKSIACLNRRLHHHPSAEITGEVLEEVYGCPVDLLAHGHPHRVLDTHARADPD